MWTKLQEILNTGSFDLRYHVRSVTTNKIRCWNCTIIITVHPIMFAITAEPAVTASFLASFEACNLLLRKFTIAESTITQVLTVNKVLSCSGTSCEQFCLSKFHWPNNFTSLSTIRKCHIILKKFVIIFDINSLLSCHNLLPLRLLNNRQWKVF